MNKDSFLYFFWICIPFISSSFLITLTSMSSMVFKRSDQRGHLYLSSINSGKVSGNFIIKNDVNCRYFVDTPHQIDKVLLYSKFTERIFKIINKCLIVSYAFPESINMIMWVFFYYLVDLIDCVKWFSKVEPVLHIKHMSLLVLVYNYCVYVCVCV